MPLDEDLARDSVELARMSLETDNIDDRLLLVRMALLVRRQAALDEGQQGDLSAEHIAQSVDQ